MAHQICNKLFRHASKTIHHAAACSTFTSIQEATVTLPATAGPPAATYCSNVSNHQSKDRTDFGISMWSGLMKCG